MPVTPARAWEHHLREAIPARIPHDDNTLQEVRLEGSFNLAPETENRGVLLAEALRTLRPEAAISVRGLAGDCPCSEPIALPGPAAAVQHVPAVSDVADELARAGFVDIKIEKLSETAYFVVGGVPMRELRITARKPGYRPRVQSHRAVYLGPMRQVVDDFGTVLRRGVPTSMNIHDWQMLAKKHGEQFVPVLETWRFERTRLLRGRERGHRVAGTERTSQVPSLRCRPRTRADGRGLSN